MKIKAYQCLKCKDTIYSRATHDFHWCSCRSIAIDGGFQYMKLSFPGGCYTDHVVEREIEVLPGREPTEVITMLYNDWNTNKNKYGVIKSKEKVG